VGWHYVGRAEQLERVRAAFDDATAGPLVISGQRGIGRSALALRALEYVDMRRDHVVRVDPHPSGAPLAALAHVLPAGFDTARGRLPTVRSAADELLRLAGQRRAVLLVDDAHLVDHLTMLVLRELVRGGALVLLTRPACVPTPDPTECLRPIQTVHIPPLTVAEVGLLLEGLLDGPVHHACAAALHATSGGNPRELRELLIGARLTELMARQNGLWRLGPCPREHRALDPDVLDPAGVLAAVDAAWSALDLDRTEQLCLLALWAGQGSRIPAVWSATLLVRGRPDEAERFLAGLAGSELDEQAECRLLITRALNLALGLGQVQTAARVLADAAHHAGRLRGRLLAHRAWVLTLARQPDVATHAAQLAAHDLGGDREAALMVKTARGVAALQTGSPTAAISQLRPALALADGQRHTMPWLRPYLNACLIDALLLAGRAREATAYASSFHGGAPGSGWDVAVALSTLTTHRSGARRAW